MRFSGERRHIEPREMVMADDGEYDRDRRRRRRGPRRDYYETYDTGRDMLATQLMPSKPPVILAKPPVEKTTKVFDGTTESDDITNSSVNSDSPLTNSLIPDKPPILLKLRENDSIPRQPLNGSVPNLPGLMPGDNNSTQMYAIRRPTTSRTLSSGKMTPLSVIEGSSEARLAAPPEMTRSIKLIDDSFTWSESGMEMLLDQTDFLVVGVLGMQGVGKSTILSHLAAGEMEESTRLVFRPQSNDAKDTCTNQTIGVDMYVTSGRIIYLDTQPILSASLLDGLVHHDKKFPADYSTAENCIEMQSLQIASFLLTVCNVVVVVADWFIDPALLRLLRTAELLKPPTPVHDNNITDEYYPHIVTVLNHAQREDFSVEAYGEMQIAVNRLMDKSKLKYSGGVTMARAGNLPSLTKRTVQHDTNLFLIPSRKPHGKDLGPLATLMPEFQGHPGFQSLVNALRKTLLSTSRHLLTHTTLSEKNWFHYAGRTWESIKKSQIFSEYNRLLP